MYGAGHSSIHEARSHLASGVMWNLGTRVHWQLQEDGFAQWTELNRHCCKKDLVKTSCEERLQITQDGNETIPVLEKKASRRAASGQCPRPCRLREVVHLDNGELRREQPAYGKGRETLLVVLSRLGNWLMNWPDKDHEETTKMLPMATSATMRKPVRRARRRGKNGQEYGPTKQAKDSVPVSTGMLLPCPVGRLERPATSR